MKLVQGPKAALTRARALSWKLRPHRSDPYGLRVLLYHRVSDDRDPLALHPRRFKRQMEHLARTGYTGIDVADGARAAVRRELPPSRSASPSTTASGISRKRLACSRSRGSPRPSCLHGRDRRECPVLVGTGRRRAAQLGRAARARRRRDDEDRGAQPHAPESPLLDYEDCRREINESKVALEGQIGRESLVFCYPGGSWACASGSGGGCRIPVRHHVRAGLERSVTDPLLVARIQIDKTDSVGDFAAKIRGSHDRLCWTGTVPALQVRALTARARAAVSA